MTHRCVLLSSVCIIYTHVINTYATYKCKDKAYTHVTWAMSISSYKSMGHAVPSWYGMCVHLQ